MSAVILYLFIGVFLYVALIISGEDAKEYFKLMAFTDEDKYDAKLMSHFWPLICLIVSLLWPLVIAEITYEVIKKAVKP